ncbi:MAG: MaoC/PaaZ C-terminal domain-containing protein [Rhodoferax sp.]
MNPLQRADVTLGQELPSLELPAVNRTMLALFAGGSGDHNPIHIDTDFARRAGMPDVFAQGMLGMAWMCRLLTNWAPQSQLRKVDARFAGITHLGHQITCRGKVVELLQVGDEHCARIELSTSNQYGQTRIAGEALIALH